MAMALSKPGEDRVVLVPAPIPIPRRQPRGAEKKRRMESAVDPRIGRRSVHAALISGAGPPRRPYASAAAAAPACPPRWL
jgi:hypothetical protein